MLKVQTMKAVIKAYLDFKSCSNELLENDTLETLRELMLEYDYACFTEAPKEADK